MTGLEPPNQMRNPLRFSTQSCGSAVSCHPCWQQGQDRPRSRYKSGRGPNHIPRPGCQNSSPCPKTMTAELSRAVRGHRVGSTHPKRAGPHRRQESRESAHPASYGTPAQNDLHYKQCA